MKIFISSTYEDLKEHRRAVRAAILRLGHQPIGMEDFGSQPKEPKVAALDKVAECDSLVGIYAHRYGMIPHGDSRSVTEQEFDKAQAVGIKCLCYRVDPNFKWADEFKDSGEKAEKLARFLKKIDSKLLRSIFTTPDDLAKQVGIDVAREFPKDFSFTAYSALHSLPTPPADFTGRENELTQLLSSSFDSAQDKPATHHSSLITGLSGMGGVGKTALALVAAHELAEKFPDAQIYLDLKGTTTPLSPRDVMQFVIHAFDPQADLRQASDDQIAALYRSLLSNKRALLLLDNAGDAAQVKPLIPPPTCALLVTSRKHFTLAGLQPIRLDVMSKSEARDLLLKLSARIGAHADEIARLCGYLPLALEIAAGFIAEHGDVSIETYATRLNERKGKRIGLLKKEDEPDLNVEAAFALSYDQLMEENRARWRALAVFPAPFDASAAASVWAMDRESADNSLGELVRYSLANYFPLPAGEGQGEGGRYSLHDLLADFAAARLSDSERETADLRHAQHYQKISRSADQLFRQGNDSVLNGLALFDSEWPHIYAGQVWAEANTKDDNSALELCDDYPTWCSNILPLRLHSRERIRWFETALGAAKQLNRKQSIGLQTGNLGLASADLGEARKAIEFYDQALAISRDIGAKHNEGMHLGNLGYAYLQLGDARKAIEYTEQALAMAREAGNKFFESILVGNLRLASADLGEMRKAIEFYEQAISITREIGNKPSEGEWLFNPGFAYEKLGKKEKAIQFTEQALKIYEAIESPYSERARKRLEELRKK